MSVRLYCPMCAAAVVLPATQDEGRPLCPRCGGTLRIGSSAEQGVGNGSHANGGHSHDYRAASDRAESGPSPPPVWTAGQQGYRDWVTIRRSVVWWQGGLLLAVGLAGFCCGLLVRPQFAGRGESELPSVAIGHPLAVEGRLSAADREPIAGGLAILWPAVLSLDTKFSAAELLAATTVDSQAESVQQRMRELGGDLAVTDEEGRFQLAVVTGEYYVLLIDTARPSVNFRMQTRSLAELGRYVTDAFELSQERKVFWKQMHFKDAARLDHTFDVDR